jgi:hypothetical protein
MDPPAPNRGSLRVSWTFQPKAIFLTMRRTLNNVPRQLSVGSNSSWVIGAATSRAAWLFRKFKEGEVGYVGPRAVARVRDETGVPTAKTNESQLSSWDDK